jgi:hypothetical protein
MEIWELILLTIVAFGMMMVLIGIATNYFRVDKTPDIISGDKDLAIDDILNLVYDCYDHNEGKKESVVCYNFNIELDKDVFSSDIIDKVNENKINKSSVYADDLGVSGKIVILYEDQFIHIKKVGYERIST